MKEKREIPPVNQRVNTLRSTLGLTMEKFGERLGVKKAAVSKWESGDNISEQIFKAICREFNVSEEWLRDGIGDMFIIPEDETATLVEDLLTDKDNVTYRAILSLVKTYQQLSPESKKIVDKFIHDAIENEKNREA